MPPLAKTVAMEPWRCGADEDLAPHVLRACCSSRLFSALKRCALGWATRGMEQTSECKCESGQIDVASASAARSPLEGSQRSQVHRARRLPPAARHVGSAGGFLSQSIKQRSEAQPQALVDSVLESFHPPGGLEVAYPAPRKWCRRPPGGRRAG